MKEIESVALVGLGAVGTVLAAQLRKTMPGRFLVIADTDRQQKLRQNGIVFNGERFDFDFAEGPQDLILIATKATALHEALDIIAPHVGPQTLILSLLNGIDSEGTVAERFGEEHVLYSYFLGHPSMREGNRIDHDGNYHIYFGEANNRPDAYSDKVMAVKKLFDKTGIPYRIPEDMISALWQKFIINIGCNQTTALLRRPYGHLQRNKRAMALAVGMMTEAQRVAERLGIAGAQDMVRRAVEVIEAMNPEGKSSMQQDAESGRPTEIDIFAGTLCRLARQLDIPVPMNRAAGEILSAL